MSKKFTDRRSAKRPPKAEPSPLEESLESGKLRRGCHIAALVIVCALFLFLCRCAAKGITWPKDHFTDMNVLMAGENFAEHGFFRLRFLPVEYVGGIGETPGYYLHYPPLPSILNGILRTVGIESLTVMRGFCSLLLVIGLYCMYRAFAPLIGALAAVCGLAFMSTAPYLTFYGISLHHTYNVFFLGLFVLLFLRAVNGGDDTRWSWVGCWIVLLLHSLSSFEFIMYAQVFAWTYVIVMREVRKRWLTLVVLGLAPLVGVGLHFLQNIWAVGWTETCTDALGMGHFGRESRIDLLRELWWSLQGRSQWAFLLPLHLLLMLGVVCLTAVRYMKPPGVRFPRVVGLFLAATLAAMAWYFFLPDHSRHPHTINQVLPLVFVILGGAISVVLHLLVKRGTPISVKVLAVAAALALLPGQISALLGPDKRGALPSTVISQALGPEVFPKNVGVLFNTLGSAHLKYFVRRPAWPCPSDAYPFPESVPKIRSYLPEGYELKYYVFYGPPTREYVAMLTYLSETCPGKMAVVPGFRNPERFVILFDISGLAHPPGERVPLDPKIADQQRGGRFERWDIPDFAERVRRAQANQVAP